MDVIQDKHCREPQMVVRRNSEMAQTCTLTFNTFYPNQSQIELNLYQVLADRNRLAGKLTIYAIPVKGQYKSYTGKDASKNRILVQLIFNENGLIESTEAWDSKLKVKLVAEWDSLVTGLTKSEIRCLREKLQK